MTHRLRILEAAFWAAALAVSPVVADEAAPASATPREVLAPTDADSPTVLAQALSLQPSAPHHPAPEPLAPPPPWPALPVEPEPVDQWLDEVRTQRRAWEERRRAAKDAADARRRRIDPWGAAQQDAREQETKRRRDAFRETIEREREAFRNSGPWAMQPAPRQDSPPQPPTANDPTTPEGQNAAPTEPYPPLPGWDNRWYYRGF